MDEALFLHGGRLSVWAQDAEGGSWKWIMPQWCVFYIVEYLYCKAMQVMCMSRNVRTEAENHPAIGAPPMSSIWVVPLFAMPPQCYTEGSEGFFFFLLSDSYLYYHNVFVIQY